MISLRPLIESAYEDRADITPQNAPISLKDSVQQVIELLDMGQIRVAEKINGEWRTHEWIKKTVLLYFRLFENRVIQGAYTNYFDKVPLKFIDETRLKQIDNVK